jgi:hypothetical protein
MIKTCQFRIKLWKEFTSFNIPKIMCDYLSMKILTKIRHIYVLGVQRHQFCRKILKIFDPALTYFHSITALSRFF